MARLKAKAATPAQRAKFRAADAASPSRSTTAGFSPREMESFVSGQWVGCHVSDWVRAALWDAEEGTLWIQFESGHQEPYSVSEEMALAFAAAPSKGGFVHDYLI